MLYIPLILSIVSCDSGSSRETIKHKLLTFDNRHNVITSPPIKGAAVKSNMATSKNTEIKSLSPAGQNPDHFILTLSDEFNKGLNPDLWNVHIWYQASNPTKNYEVSNGSLKIWPERDGTGKFFDRILDTDRHFSQTYGFFEIEAKLPVGKGTWPAFWLYNHLRGNTFFPEIDIMEAYPGGGLSSGWSDKRLHPTAYAVTTWPQGASGPNKGPSHMKIITSLGDLSTRFHKYGVKWEEAKQTFYFDGKEVYSVNVTMSDPLYILLNIQFGSASGTPDTTTPVGKANSFEINYLRVWKLN